MYIHSTRAVHLGMSANAHSAPAVRTNIEQHISALCSPAYLIATSVQLMMSKFPSLLSSTERGRQDISDFLCRVDKITVWTISLYGSVCGCLKLRTLDDEIRWRLGRWVSYQGDAVFNLDTHTRRMISTGGNFGSLPWNSKLSRQNNARVSFHHCMQTFEFVNKRNKYVAMKKNIFFLCALRDIIIILSCLTSLHSSKPIQKKIYLNHEGLSRPITTQ